MANIGSAGNFRKLAIQLIVSVFVAILLSYPAFSNIELNQLWEIGSSFNGAYVLLSIMCFFIRAFARSYRLKSLSRSQEPHINFFAMICLQSFFMLILPAALGEIALVYLMNKLQKMPGSTAFASVTVARVFDLGIYLLVMTLLFLSISTNIPFAIKAVLTVGLAAFLIVIFIIVRILKRKQFIFYSENSSGFRRKIGIFLQQYLAALKEIDRQGSLCTLISTSVLVFIMNLAIMTFNIKAFNDSIAIDNIIQFNLLATPMYFLPIKGIGNLGTHEAVYFYGLQIVGVGEDLSSVLGVATHSLDLVLVSISAIVGLSILALNRLVRR